MSIVPRTSTARQLSVIMGLALIVLAGCTGNANAPTFSPDVLPLDETPQRTVIPPENLVTGTPTPLSDQEYEQLWDELRENIRADHSDVYAAVGRGHRSFQSADLALSR